MCLPYTHLHQEGRKEPALLHGQELVLCGTGFGQRCLLECTGLPSRTRDSHTKLATSFAWTTTKPLAILRLFSTPPAPLCSESPQPSSKPLRKCNQEATRCKATLTPNHRETPLPLHSAILREGPHMPSFLASHPQAAWRASR